MTTGDSASYEPNDKTGAVFARRASVYIGLGSNLGDREANLREAQERIQRLGVEITRASSVYETEPVGYADQPWFLNQVIETRIAPDLAFDAGREAEESLKLLLHEDPAGAFMFQLGELLRAVLEIETEMGRERTIANGPRVIDIDLLMCSEAEGLNAITRRGEFRSATRHAHLILPHPRMHVRRFVLEPLCEIAPDLIIAATEKTCAETLSALVDPALVRIHKSGGR
jgi:7,8-dihydro-6-hydroxymethylpterin-pyrophosphokinase